VKPAAGYRRPLAYSSPEAVQTTGTVADLASETGTFGLDDVSLTDPFLSGSDKAILNNEKLRRLRIFGQRDKLKANRSKGA